MLQLDKRFLASLGRTRCIFNKGKLFKAYNWGLKQLFSPKVLSHFERSEKTNALEATPTSVVLLVFNSAAIPHFAELSLSHQILSFLLVASLTSTLARRA